MLSQPTAVPNTPAITLQPTGAAGSTSFNPVYTQCDPTNGNYATATGRDLLSFYLFPAADFAPTWLTTTSYNLGQVVNFGGSTATITNVAITTNVATITASNTFTVGAQVTLTGLTTATFLNSVVLTVLSSSGTTFTATYGHSDYASASDTGTATVPAGIFIATNVLPTTNLNMMPSTVGLWAPYVDADADLHIFSAPDQCTGRTADVIGYNVPLADPASPPPTAVVEVEFLVLPSSVFTQANGQIQWQANSNLIYVYVRSL